MRRVTCSSSSSSSYYHAPSVAEGRISRWPSSSSSSSSSSSLGSSRSSDRSRHPAGASNTTNSSVSHAIERTVGDTSMTPPPSSSGLIGRNHPSSSAAMSSSFSSSTTMMAHSVGATNASTAPLLGIHRYASGSLLAKLGSSSDLAEGIKAGRQRNNKEVIASLEKIQTFEEVHYRKTDRPWELVVRYVRRRVSDHVGILKSEHRMEMEQVIERLLPIAEVDMYVVIVPTVGYVSTQAFANSLMFEWAIGEPKGNGLLLVICQQEATVHLCASPAIEKYFGDFFLELCIQRIFQPLVKEGDPSYAILMLVYAIATHAHEARDHWKHHLLPLPVRNKVILGGKVVAYGLREQLMYCLGALIFAALTAYFWVQITDMMCPECGSFMCKVTNPELMQQIMTRGQWLEQKNQCAFYRVWKCGHCHSGTRVVLMSRDLHQSTHCLKCMDCDCYTCTLTKSIERLPTKHEDGLKKMLYTCENCRVGREIFLPLYRPIDTKPEEQWYGFLLDRSATGKKDQKMDLKL